MRYYQEYNFGYLSTAILTRHDVYISLQYRKQSLLLLNNKNALKLNF